MNCCLSSLRLRRVISHTSNCTPRRASCSTRSSYLPPFLSLAPFIRKSTPRACATTMIFAVGLTSRWLLMLRRPFDACSTPSLKWYTTLSCGLPPPDKVVYHFSDGVEQASNGLRNINNHLEVNPTAKIIVVAHARGVDFLMKGAKDKNGGKYEDLVEQLALRGVQFDVCEITLRNRKLDRQQFIADVTYVPSGVAEITRLQQREGFAYLKP